jgi:hypothetical protein
VLPDPPGDDDAFELARLAQLVRAVPLPAADLPGWQSVTAREYASAVHRLADLLDAIAAALGRAAG